MPFALLRLARSGNLLEVAERAGLWDRDSQGDDVDFTQAFGMPALAGTGATIDFSPYSNRRRWRILSLAAPSLGLSPQASSYADEYPFSVKVETPGYAAPALLAGWPFRFT